MTSLSSPIYYSAAVRGGSGFMSGGSFARSGTHIQEAQKTGQAKGSDSMKEKTTDAESTWLPKKVEAPQDVELVRDTEQAAAIASARAEVEAAYAVAIKRPRDINLARAKVLEACKRKAFAGSALYSKPIGGSSIVGLSVRAAEEFVRDMGNFRTSQICTFENESIRRVKVTVTDLETNSGYSQELTLRKTVERHSDKGRKVVDTRLNKKEQLIFIVEATEDEMLTKEGAAVSKAIRNQGLRLMPSDILEEARESIDATNKSKSVESAKEEAKKIVSAFFDHGVKPEDITAYYDCPIEGLTAADVDELRRMYVAIRDGETRWPEFVRQKREADAEGKGASGVPGKKKPLQKPAGKKPATDPAAAQSGEKNDGEEPPY